MHFGGKGEYVGQWFDDVTAESQADVIDVAEGATTPGIDAELALGATVEGVVTDATSGTGVPRINVCASTATSDPINNGCTTTGSDGHYRLVGIPTGEYELRLEPEFGAGDPDYLRHYYPAAPSLDGGPALHLTDGSTMTGVDTTMERGGTISGKVVNEAGEPVAGVSVCTYPIFGEANFGECFGGRATTASDGTYTIHAVRSGEWKVNFFGSGAYLPDYYPSQPTRAAGAIVTVTAPEAVTGIDTTLDRGGSISGTLLESGTHAAIPGAEICAVGVDKHTIHCDQAGMDGDYSITGLPADDYEVEFARPGSSSDWPYVTSFYDGASSLIGATPVEVATAAAVAGIDGEVSKGGTISGKVTDAISSEPAERIYVCAYVGGEVVGQCDTTHASGEYTIVGLPAGSYTVRATPAGGGDEQDFLVGDQAYMSEYYEDGATEAEATPVASGPGNDAAGIDLAMHEGGGISGTITGPLGEPLESIEACVVTTAEQIGERCGASNAGGEYTIQGLNPGSYTVYFWGAGLRSNELTPQYFDGVLNFDEAHAVTVTGTAVTRGIDARLGVGGRIEGTVTDSYDGTPLARASVCSEKIGGPGGICVNADADGSYSMDVAAGSYRLHFYDRYYEEENEVEEFVPQYFSGAAGPGAATIVTVGSGATVPRIDAALAPAPMRLDKVSVGTGGGGAGTVTSSPAGIDCGTSCSSNFETRKSVTLNAEPSPGSTFTGWTGACSGTGPCQIRLTAGVEVAATFESSGETSSTTGQGSSTQSTNAPGPDSTTQTVTPKGGPPRVTPKPEPKPKRQCRKGLKLKKFGKRERCVKVPKKHHPRKHHAARH